MNKIFEGNVTLKVEKPEYLIKIFKLFHKMSDDQIKEIADIQTTPGKIDKAWIDTYWNIINNDGYLKMSVAELPEFRSELTRYHSHLEDNYKIPFGPEVLEFKSDLNHFEKVRITAILGVFLEYIKCSIKKSLENDPPRNPWHELLNVEKWDEHHNRRSMEDYYQSAKGLKHY